MCGQKVPSAAAGGRPCRAPRWLRSDQDPGGWQAWSRREPLVSSAPGRGSPASRRCCHGHGIPATRSSSERIHEHSISNRSPNTCSCFRLAVRDYQRPEQPAIVTSWPAACSGACSLCRSAAVRPGLPGAGRPTVKTGALDSGRRLACVVLAPSPPLFPGRCTG
jgi:hypothetical protein